MKQNTSPPENLSFLYSATLYTKEKMNLDSFLKGDTIVLARNFHGPHPDTLQAEMEIKFRFNYSRLTVKDYVIDSISRVPDPLMSKRMNKNFDFWYCYGTTDYYGRYTFDDSILTLNLWNTSDSSVIIENLNYRVELKRWKDALNYDVDFIKVKGKTIE